MLCVFGPSLESTAVVRASSHGVQVRKAVRIAEIILVRPSLKLSRGGQRMKCDVQLEDDGAINGGFGRRWLGRLDGLFLHGSRFP